MNRAAHFATLAAAIMMPGLAFAHGSADRNAPSRGDQQTSQRGDYWQREVSRASRGGGPNDANANPSGQSSERPNANDRTALLHNTSPRLITAETALQVAQDRSTGLERVLQTAGSQFTAAYKDQVGALAGDIQRDMDTARTHLNFLRDRAEQLGRTQQVRGDLQRATASMQEADRTLNMLQREKDQNGVAVSTMRSHAHTVTSQLAAAKSAIQHVERGLR